MTARPSLTRAARKPKFRAGQVVALELAEGRGFAYGQFVRYTKKGPIELQFWDFDLGSFWTWDYEPDYVRPLTKRERGK